MLVLLDTNFLMAIFQLGLDVFEELRRLMDEPYTVAIVDKTISELEMLAQGNQKQALPARMALRLIKERRIEILPTKEGHTDDLLVSLARAEDAYVATNDKGLKQRLRRVIFIRQKRYLQKKG
ncbi:MAG: PIN domain-containing protein [DPANN group archaeon]|nr:PIN domain-containing protein [DPANN group archaeon]